MAPAAAAPDFQPYSPEFAADPYAVYAVLRERTPVFHSAELGMTMLTRHADILRALTDRRLARAAPEGQPPAARGMPFYDRYVRVNLLETEGETHARLRRLLAGALGPKRIAGLAARVEEIADARVSRAVGAGEIDFVREVAEPLPVTMISELLGWPEAERHRLRPWSADIVRLYDKDASSDDRARAEAATRDFACMLDALAAERRTRPADDLISALAAREDEPGGLDRSELVASCMLLLNAGHEATVNAAANGLLALLTHESEMRRLREDPSLLDTAVEEMLRFDAPLHLFHRYALEDLEIAGQRVPRGTMVGLLYGSANRDPAAFSAPDVFDVGRTPNRHLSFGAATHFCLGAPLARLELRTLFRTLLARCRRIELAEAPAWRAGLVFRGLRRLAVRID